MQVALVLNKRFGTDGISLFVLNNYRHFGHEGVKYHLIYPEKHGDDGSVESYLNEFTRNGDSTALVSKGHGLCRFARHFVSYLRQNKIDMIHIHGSSAGVLLEAVLAKWGGCKCVIVHSHSTHGNHVLIHYALRPFVGRLADVRLACGELAGQWMYGKRKDFTVIPNGVDTGAYRFCPQIRENVRRELGLADGAFVIGHVGAFSAVKNQAFLLHLIKQIADEGDSQTILMLIGDGPTRAELTAAVERTGLTERVMFLGVRHDVSRLMAAMDAFCLPSLFEGFPIVAVEAQASGLPVIISSAVSSEVCITDRVKRLPLNEGTEQWKAEISRLLNSRGNRQCYADAVREAGFDIHDSAQMLETIYRRNDKSINAEHGADELV